MGMARSGTSLVSALLNRLGLFLGHRKIANDEEATFFFRLNAILLRQIHGEFDNPAPMRYFLQDSGSVEMSVKCLEADLASYRIVSYLGPLRYLKYRSLRCYDRPWGWKDPLNTYTLPLWLKLFPGAKILYIVRNGVDVAHSLVGLHRSIVAKRQIRNRRASRRLSLRRNVELFGFKGAVRCLSLEGSFSLWEEFVAQAEETLARFDNERMSVKYEDFLADPKMHLLELARFCGLKETSQSAIDEAAQSVDSGRSNAFVSSPDLMSFYRRVKASRWMLYYGYSVD
jgi:hypothetical protein